MTTFRGAWVALVLVASTGCASPNLVQRHDDARPAVAALRSGSFAEAQHNADEVIRTDPGNPYALLVRAITRYRSSMHQLSTDLRTVVIGGVTAGGFNHRYMRSSLVETEQVLGSVEADLAEVSEHSDITLELCLACWEVDWNHNGRIDRSDGLLFQIEQDAQGNPIPEDDPRRKPTFRFDHGDVAWARAFVSFQRAIIEVLLAYDWAGIDQVLRDDLPPRIVVRLSSRERVATAREHVLRGLKLSEEARQAYLRETDDDREWVPNPKQRSHPLPLPVDEALYETWGGVVGDLERIVAGKEGLSVKEIAQLGDHVWDRPPEGFIDVGRMLSDPKDIVIEVAELERLESDEDVEGVLRSLFGDYYVRDMKPSPLPRRLARMKSEVDRGEETMERKLRYLIWIN